MRLIFAKENRPSLAAFQRYRRKLGLPCYRLGKRVIYDLDELEDAIKKLKRPKPEA